MPSRWIVCGVWVVLFVCSRNSMAEEPTREIPNVVKRVTFLGAKHIKENDLRKIVGIKEGTPLNPNLNRQGCQKILAKYGEMSRGFASCKLLKGGNLADTEVVYQITEGPKGSPHHGDRVKDNRER